MSETLLVQGFDIIFKELNRYIKIMNGLFQGIDWATYVKSRTQTEAQSKKKEALLDEPEELAASGIASPESKENTEGSREELSEEKLKLLAEEKQKKRVAQHLAQIDKVYKESFVKRLLAIVEMFTCVQSSKLYQKRFKETLLAKMTSSSYISTLLNLLILASPQVKHIVLKII